MFSFSSSFLTESAGKKRYQSRSSFVRDLPLDFLTFSFSFFVNHEISKSAIRVNRSCHVAALHSFKKRTALSIGDLDIRKGFDVLVLHDRFAHVRELKIDSLSSDSFSAHLVPDYSLLLQKIAKCLLHLPLLTFLDFSRCQSEDEAIAAVALELSHLSSLVHLDLSSNCLSGWGWVARALSFLPKLEL